MYYEVGSSAFFCYETSHNIVSAHLSVSPITGGGGSSPADPIDNASSFMETSTKNLKRKDGGNARRYSDCPPAVTSTTAKRNVHNIAHNLTKCPLVRQKNGKT